ncbi:acyltransferase family protein [uncultured Akkermansia sp.]|uniref:acyltransferase family protein n=1 Tax=uncultured Akkermansia sp. TaxID=512294 RepID=UPI00261D30B4|nr:acyltransferase family protein [uncultured Akkermansia sp.]
MAGYFLGRNITWNKAFNRALWLFIPFMFWNVLYVLLVLPHDGASFRLENLIGIRDVFLPGINLFPADDSHAVPPIGPSWFLRDIIILTLLTPLLVRVKILLFPAVLLFFCFFNVAPDHMETISIGTCAFYLLGVALSSRKIDDIHLVLNKKFGIFFWVSIFMPVVLIALYSAGMIPLWKETAIGMLLGVMMIMYAGIWMEKHLPGLSAKIALLAPACFLTFMLHWPIYDFLPPVMKIQPVLAVFTPLLVFAAIVLFYFALKRFAPFLLPYLAHVKHAGQRQERRSARDETVSPIRGLSGRN